MSQKSSLLQPAQSVSWVLTLDTAGARSQKKRISYGPSAISDLFANTPTRKHAVRIDTKLLAEAESEDPRKRKVDAAEALRKVVATVGKRGEPGEHVRCVVSVTMLTEGWDPNNVTQVLGIRAFGSQLLFRRRAPRQIGKIWQFGQRDIRNVPDPQRQFSMRRRNPSGKARASTRWR
jgi:hypothetical protein